MSHRYIRFSLLSAAFLLGSTSLLLAMEESSAENIDNSNSCRALIPYQSPEEVLFKSTSLQPESSSLSQEDHDYFKLIESFKNPVPQTNSDLDEIQPRLKAPLVAELPLGKYLFLKNLSDRWNGFNPTLFVGVLENGTKVFIKKTVDVFDEETQKFFRRYEGDEAITELVAPRVARAYFDAPTLLPTELILGDNGKCELRQYFIDNALSDNVEDVKLEKLVSTLYLRPEIFNRQNGFIDLLILKEFFLSDHEPTSEKYINKQIQRIRRLLTRSYQQFNLPTNFKGPLSLFDNFIIAEDRNVTNFLWVPPYQKDQKWTFLAIDYEETYEYNPETGRIEQEDSDRDNDGCIAPLSALRKLNYLSKIYRSFFNKAEALAPEDYNDRFFTAMAQWQNELLTSYQGRTIDDLNYVSSTLVNSNRFNILMLEDSLRDSIKDCRATKLVRFHPFLD